MNIIENYKHVVFDNYANFKGRARRSEFWYYVLANIIIAFVIGFVEGLLGFGNLETTSTSFNYSGGVISNIYSLLVLVPGLAVGVRRLHDTGKSGWNYLLILIPLAGAIILIVFFATEGESGPNKYGKDPKNPDFSTEDHLLD
jgi:uncharacterized membrane protein YhaH (DUF805 family)